jgi:hypothetical protein
MKESVESLGRVRAQAMVLLVFAFLAGAFVGGTVERLIGRPWRGASRTAGRGGLGADRGGGPGADRTTRPPGRLLSSYEALGLSGDQRAKIEAILAKRSPRVDSVMKSACVVIGPAMDSTRKDIDAVLTADQKAKRDSTRGARPGTRGSGVGRGGPFGCGPGMAAPATKK